MGRTARDGGEGRNKTPCPQAEEASQLGNAVSETGVSTEVVKQEREGEGTENEEFAEEGPLFFQKSNWQIDDGLRVVAKP